MLVQISEYDCAILNHADLPEEEGEVELDNIDQFERPAQVEMARLTASMRLPDRNGTAWFQSAGNATPTPLRVTFGDNPVHSTPLSLPAHSVKITSHGIPKELDLAPERFDGGRLKFRQFKKLFECWIGRRTSATSRERLMVLRKYLAGDPRDLIDPLELSDANYSIARSLLELNFSRVDTERERILTELRDLRPRMSNPYDSINLRRLPNVVQRNTRILESLVYPFPSIVPLLKSSIDAAVHLKIRQEFREQQRLEARFASLSQGPGSRQIDVTDAAPARRPVNRSPLVTQTA